MLWADFLPYELPGKPKNTSSVQLLSRVRLFDPMDRSKPGLSPTPQFKSINFSVLSFLHGITLTTIHDHWKNQALTRWTFVGKVISLLFNMLSRLVITFLPRSKRLLISWLQSPSAVILEPPRIKSDTASTVSSPISHAVMGPDVEL